MADTTAAAHVPSGPVAGTTGAEDPAALEVRERYRELLEELRTILPGVQVLFAFLLTAPFSQRFGDLDRVGRDGYMVAMVAAATAVVLFSAPTSFHRVAPRQQRHLRLRTAIALTVVGMIALLTAVTSAVFVVTRFIFGTGEGLAVAGGVAAAAFALWYLAPLVSRLRTPAD
jgi:MFS family permease